MHLLIVEDEKDLAESMTGYLQRGHYNCDMALDFGTALQKIETSYYDCIVLDLTLPGGSGLSLLRTLKEQKKSDGVLIISARNSLDDRIMGLELGADDYLSKPFHLAELAARLQAIIRRRSFNGNNSVLVDRLEINMLDKSVKWMDLCIDLTRKEYELLLYFVSNQGRVVSKESIVDHLWSAQGGSIDSFDLVYSHIRNLRRKLSEAGCPDFIRAVYGMGYKFTGSENGAR